MQNSMDREEASGSDDKTSAVECATSSERVFTEPIDEYGIILLETRIAADGTTTTRKITRKGRPVLTIEECAAMECPYPPEPDCWS
jgi:hypothetical protein